MSRRSGASLGALNPHAPSPNWSDARLVRACLEGNEQGWAALIQKYQRLIYSIPIRYHAPPQEAADIFQAVCLELFSELPKVRKTESLRSWLITVAVHKSYQWKKKQGRWSEQTPEEAELNDSRADGSLPLASTEYELMESAEREQLIREGLRKLPERCQEMIRLLFFEEPPLPYNEVAQRLGLATGSIGFIRGRCLKKMQKVLEEMGFS